jgi:hypothetical protein
MHNRKIQATIMLAAMLMGAAAPAWTTLRPIPSSVLGILSSYFNRTSGMALPAAIRNSRYGTLKQSRFVDGNGPILFLNFRCGAGLSWARISRPIHPRAISRWGACRLP